MKFVAFAALSLVATTAAAQDPAPAPTAAAKPAKPEKVCRNMNTTGSIMGTRVCHTRADWAQIDEANAQSADRALAHRSRTMSGPQ